MQINNVSVYYNQNYPNFKALKSIKFCDELEINSRAKNELLKIFDHQPIKDLFTKFDAEVNFKPNFYHVTERKRGNDIVSGFNDFIYNVGCEVNLIRKGCEDLLQHYKELAHEAGVTIDDSINGYIEKQRNCQLKLDYASYQLLNGYNNDKNLAEIKMTQSYIKTEREMLEKLKSKIQEMREKGEDRPSNSDFRELCCDLGHKHDVIMHEEIKLQTLKEKCNFYEENKDIFHNPFAVASRLLVRNIKKMTSEDIYNNLSNNIKTNEIIEKELNEKLQEAIIGKNVESKLKELLGENYVEPKKQAKTNITKKNCINIEKPVDKIYIEANEKLGVNIAKPIHKPQEVEEMGVSKGRKTRKPSVKKSDKE